MHACAYTNISASYTGALRRALPRAPRRAGGAAGGGRRAGHGRHQRLLPRLAPVRALAHHMFKILCRNWSSALPRSRYTYPHSMSASQTCYQPRVLETGVTYRFL